MAKTKNSTKKTGTTKTKKLEALAKKFVGRFLDSSYRIYNGGGSGNKYEISGFRIKNDEVEFACKDDIMTGKVYFNEEELSELLKTGTIKNKPSEYRDDGDMAWTISLVEKKTKVPSYSYNAEGY